jgi:steroid delta-isomerase-like uncharacterized protein
MTNTAKQNKELVREGIEAINDGDAERLRDLVADDVIMHGQGGQDVRGAEQVVPVTVNNAAFPDRILEIEQLVAEGDTVVARMRFVGTHEGNMHGVEPTGEEIDIRVMSMYRIEDGQLAEAWFVEDDADTLRQLGLWQELTA